MHFIQWAFLVTLILSIITLVAHKREGDQSVRNPLQRLQIFTFL